MKSTIRLFIMSSFIILNSINAQGACISKGAAIDIAVKEAYERNYKTDEIYVLKNETLWQRAPKLPMLKGTSLEEINKKLENLEYWSIYFSGDQRTVEYDIAIFVNCANSEIISIEEEKKREKTKHWQSDEIISIGEAIDIADKEAEKYEYCIEGKYYWVKKDSPPWEDFPNRTGIFKRKYSDKYSYFFRNKYWSVRYFSIKPTHDGGLCIYINSETGEPFFKAGSFVFSE